MKKILIAAGVGLVLGTAVFILGNAGDMSLPVRLIVALLIMPLAVNIEYWGWVASWAFLRRLNIFLIMTPFKWLLFFLILFLISYVVGLGAFPAAIVRAAAAGWIAYMAVKYVGVWHPWLIDLFMDIKTETLKAYLSTVSRGALV